MSKLLRLFAATWTVIVGLTLAIACVGAFITAPSVWSGVTQIWSWFSPFNIMNWLTVMLFWSPALGATWLAGRLDERREARRQALIENPARL